MHCRSVNGGIPSKLQEGNIPMSQTKTTTKKPAAPKADVRTKLKADTKIYFSL